METAIITEKPNTQFSRFSRLNLEKIPTYVAFNKIWGSSMSEPLEDLYRMREFVIVGLICGTALTHWENNIAARFEQLSEEVFEECMMVSSPSQIALHPSYQEIIGLGKNAIPLLIRKLDEVPTMWFWALEAITGVNPVPKKHKGKVSVMVQDWKNWAKENAYE